MCWIHAFFEQATQAEYLERETLLRLRAVPLLLGCDSTLGAGRHAGRANVHNKARFPCIWSHKILQRGTQTLFSSYSQNTTWKTISATILKWDASEFSWKSVSSQDFQTDFAALRSLHNFTMCQVNIQPQLLKACPGRFSCAIMDSHLHTQLLQLHRQLSWLGAHRTSQMSNQQFACAFMIIAWRN